MDLKRVIGFTLAFLLVNAQNNDPGLSLLENQRLFQGDLKLGPDRRNAVLSDQRKWPNGVIRYEIRSDYNDREMEMITNAMRTIEKGTCIRFLPRSGQSDYIYIKNTDDGCYSAGVGYRRGPIEVSLQSSHGPSCMHHSIIVHELLHAVGLWHEHMRYDRDQYVKIHYDQVAPGLESQFNIVRQTHSSTYNVPYDYASIMHYSKTAFSRDKSSITIEPLQRQYLTVIGRAKDISQNDILKVNRMYNCDGTSRDPDTESTTKAPESSDCRDLSPACGQYFAFCRLWDVLRTHCRRTCNFC